MIKDAIRMCSAIEGLDYNTIMNLNHNEYVVMRNTVLEIIEARKQEMRSMRRA